MESFSALANRFFVYHVYYLTLGQMWRVCAANDIHDHVIN